jgi:transcriptional regulator with XRE-family HTH domain
MADPTLEQQQRDYLHRVMDRTGWHMTELAKRAHLDHSTLSRFLSGGREGHALRHTSINKIETASGLRFGTPIATPIAQNLGFNEAEATPLVIEREPSYLQGLITSAVAGRNNVDPWRLQSRALDAIGYMPGDILIVALGEHPQPGEVVIAQIVDWQRGGAETVFRLFEPPCLVAATSDASLLKPHVIDHAATVIKGVVDCLIRPNGRQNVSRVT